MPRLLKRFRERPRRRHRWRHAPHEFPAGASGNDDPTTCNGEPTSERGAEPLCGADPYNDSRALKRGHCRHLAGPIHSRTTCKAQSVSIGWSRQWPAENKIVVAQFAFAVKNNSNGKDRRSEVLMESERTHIELKTANAFVSVHATQILS